MVADEVVVAAEPSDDTDISAFDHLAYIGEDVEDLLDDLADEEAYEDMTFEVLTSEGLAKANDEISEYDILVVTAEDGETTEEYTMVTP